MKPSTIHTSACLMTVISTIIVITTVEGQLTPTTTNPANKINVASMLNPPYLFEEIPSQRTQGRAPVYKGFVIDLLEKIKEFEGFDYHLIVKNDGDFGHVLENGEWTGLVGQLVNREADVVIASLTETAARTRVVNFGTQFQSFGRVALVKQWPKPETKILGFTLEIRLSRLFAPLEDSVWLLSGLAWFVSSLILYLICRVNPYEWRRMAHDREATLREGESFSCVNSYWFMLGAVFWQGFMRSPRSMGARIVVTFWWLYALIFVSMYIASLTNFLQSLPYSAPKQTNNFTSIKTLQDIIDNPNVQVGVVANGSTWTSLQTSKNQLYRKLWEKMENDKSYAKFVVEGISRVRNSTRDNPYVFIAESTMAAYFIRQPPCDIGIIRDFPMTGSYSFAFPINSKWQSAMDIIVNKLKEDGTLANLEQKWFTGECKGDIIEQNKETKHIHFPPFQKVDLTSFSGALILLIIGLAAGSIVTVIEYFIFKFTEEDLHDHHRKDIRPLNEKNNVNNMHGKSSKSMEPMTDV